MKDILEILYNADKEAPLPAEAAENLKKNNEMMSGVFELEPKPVTEAEVNETLFRIQSMTQKDIIINLELKDEYNSMVNEYGEVREDLLSEMGWDHHEHSFFSYRFSVSLPEIIAEKLFPKGRLKKNCHEFEGYDEAKRVANKLNASYSRTLSTMSGHGLIKKINNNYIITDKGKEIFKAKC